MTGDFRVCPARTAPENSGANHNSVHDFQGNAALVIIIVFAIIVVIIVVVIVIVVVVIIVIVISGGRGAARTDREFRGESGEDKFGGRNRD